MPYLVVYASNDEQVGQVDVHELTPKRGVLARYGWNGIQLDKLWNEALRIEEGQRQREETQEERDDHLRKYEAQA